MNPTNAIAAIEALRSRAADKAAFDKHLEAIKALCAGETPEQKAMALCRKHAGNRTLAACEMGVSLKEMYRLVPVGTPL
jgi:hypothetical protein